MNPNKPKVRYWRNNRFFGWLHNANSSDEMLELSLHSRVKLIRDNLIRISQKEGK